MDKKMLMFNVLLLLVLIASFVVIRYYMVLGQKMYVYSAIAGMAVYTLFSRYVFNVYTYETLRSWKLILVTFFQSTWILLIAGYVNWIIISFIEGNIMLVSILTVILIGLGLFAKLVKSLDQTPVR